MNAENRGGKAGAASELLVRILPNLNLGRALDFGKLLFSEPRPLALIATDEWLGHREWTGTRAVVIVRDATGWQFMMPPLLSAARARCGEGLTVRDSLATHVVNSRPATSRRAGARSDEAQ